MVAATVDMVRAAVFGGELHLVQDLALTNRRLRDISALAQLTALKELNLAFNNITSLQTLSSLVELQTLNVSHNQLTSLDGLEGLSNLAQLKAGNNKIRRISALSSCRSLQAVWLQHNDLQETAQLSNLKCLDNLLHVWITPNPMTRSQPDTVSGILPFCPSLRTIDSREAQDGERSAAFAVLSNGLAPGQHLDTPWTIQGARESQMHEDLQTPQPVDTARFSSDTSGRDNYFHGGACAPDKIPRFGRRSSFGSANSPHTTAAPLQKAASKINQGRKQAAGVSDDIAISQVTDLLPDTGNMYNLPSRAMDLKTNASTRRNPRRPRECSSENKASTCDNPIGQGVSPSIKDGSPPLAALATEHSAVAANKPTKERRGSASAQYMSEYEVTYKDGTSAVAVRRDGSARISWPNTDIAVTCESEIAAGQRSFRLFAQYRLTGKLAAAFQPDGSGFIQYPHGGVLLMYNVDSGDGTVYDKHGNVKRKWNDHGADGIPPLNFSHPVEEQLDEFMGVQIAPGTGPAGKGKPQMAVFFSCEGVKQKLVQGLNPPLPVWAALDYIHNWDGTVSKAVSEPAFVTRLGGARRQNAPKTEAVQDHRPVDERMAEVSSIASTMQDLDEKLSSWLAGLKPV